MKRRGKGGAHNNNRQRRRRTMQAQQQTTIDSYYYKNHTHRTTTAASRRQRGGVVAGGGRLARRRLCRPRSIVQQPAGRLVAQQRTSEHRHSARRRDSTSPLGPRREPALSATGGMPFVLSVAMADGKTDAYLLTAGETTCGRKDAHINFDEKSVSRSHAQVVVTSLEDASQPASRPKAMLLDNSKFGTYILTEAGDARVPTGTVLVETAEDEVPNREEQRRSLFPTSAGAPGVLLKEHMRIRLGLTAPALEVRWMPLVLCVGAVDPGNLPPGFQEAAGTLTAHVVPRWHQKSTHLVCLYPLTSPDLSPDASAWATGLAP